MPKHVCGYDTVYIALKALKSAHKATFSHSIRVAKVAVRIAAKMDSELDVTPNDVKDAALYHDIGKLFVPVHILEKNGALTLREKENVLPHPVWGEQILLTSSDHRVRNLARFVREHHESADGSGYPAKLTLDEINPVSRVINIADRFAALTENRPYREALAPEFAIETLKVDIKAFFGAEAGKVIDVLAAFRAIPGQSRGITSFGPQTAAYFQPNLAMGG